MTNRARLPRAFFVLSQRSLIDAVAAIDGVDLEVSLLATRPRFLDGVREQLPRALAYNLLDAWAGAWPEEDPRAFRGVGADTLAELRPYEGSAIAMLDRANWTGASAMAMRSIYLRHVEIWDTLIRERRPDLVVIHGDPHRCWDYLLHALCRERGITTAIVERTLLADRLVLKPSIEHMGGPPRARVREVADAAQRHAADDPIRLPTNASYYAREIIPQERDMDALDRQLQFRSSLPGVLGRMANVFRPYEPRFPRVVPDTPITQWKRKQFNVRTRRLITRTKEAYRGAARVPSFTTPTIYFPLHYQPEATTLPAGGLMYHQVNAVRLLHSALPEGWRIAVKEHPQMLKYGREWPRARGTTFYEELTALEHVDLAPVDFPSAELIERAAIVATIAGSAGWEALLCGRFVIAFGYPFYGRAPGVTLASTVADCESAIADAAAHDFRADLGLLQAFVDEFVEHHTFLGPWDDESARHSDSGWEGLVAGAAERLRHLAAGIRVTDMAPVT